MDVNGQITIDSPYSRFARATERTPTADPTLTIDGYKIIIDTRMLSHDLVPASMFDSGIVLSRVHINELTLVPATQYEFRAPMEPVTELTFGLDTDGAIDVVEAPPGATIKSSTVPGTQVGPASGDNEGKATRLILVRPADLLLLGVGWIGCSRAGDRLTVTDHEAALTVLLPSQSLEEACVDSGGGADVRPALRAGASWLEVRLGLPEGAEVRLTTEGILTALAGGTVIDGGVEAPFGLMLDLKGAGAVLRLGHRPAVLTEGGVTSLWQLPVGGPDGGLTVLRASRGSGDDAFEQVAKFAPLNVGDRGQIIVSGPVTLEYLRLTALGASFSAHQAIENFRWDHRAALGRDARVVVERTGILWPFNHRAVLTKTAGRVIENGVAGLRLNTELRITEPVRSFPDDRSAAAHAFPFTEVEVLARSVSGLKDNWQLFPRPGAAPQTLLDDRDQLQQQVQDAWATVAALRFPLSQSELAGSDFSGSVEASRLEVIQPTITEDEGLLKADADARAQQPAVPQHHLPGTENPDHPDDPGPDPGVTPEPDPRILSFEQAQRIRGELTTLQLEEAPLLAVVNQRLAELAPFAAQEGNPEGLADVGQRDALDLRDLKARMVALQGRIDRFGTPLPRVLVPCTDNGTDLGDPVLFHIRCAGTLGDVSFAMPLVFVNDLVVPGDDVVEEFRTLDDSRLHGWVRDALDLLHAGGPVPVAGARIDLVRDPVPRAADIQEVHALRLDGVHENRGFRPVVNGFDIEVPELRSLLPELRTRVTARFDPDFAAGSRTDAAIALEAPVTADFAQQAERGGGLIMPTFTADVVSRTFGPVDRRALPGATDTLAAFEKMRLLGIPLSSLLPAATPPPEIVKVQADGRPPGVRMSWRDLHLKSNGILVAHAAPHSPAKQDTTTVTLIAELTPDSAKTRCEMSAFMLSVPASAPVLELSFTSLIFEQADGGAPHLDLDGFGVSFAGPLDLLKKLESAIDLGDTAPTVDATPEGLTVSYGMNLPSIPPCGVFELRNIAVRVAVEIPFRGGPPAVKLSFATPDDPFQLKVLMFGGGGYLQLTVDGTGLKRLEGVLDFGASVAVNFGIAQAEVHALGGVRYVMEGDTVRLTGFIRLGGSIDILGLVSVSIDLLVELTYDSQHNRLTGHATLVIDIDLTLYSDTVQLDSGEWVLAGDGGEAAPGLDGGDAGRADWTRYQEAYAR
ncbi:hypothetical protein [Kitasatospora sp. NPDC097691]|uniref:hypothetical protein n=1 Tax=Kitasatospora sp. NPDC097691 TaxID=3157231 RepID=UPI00332BABC5